MSSIYLTCAYLLDLIIGDPIGIPHPIIYIGKLISFFENKIRKYMGKYLKIGGFLLVISVLAIVFSVTSLITWVVGFSKLTLILGMIYFLNTALAAKCLNDEAKKVSSKLEAKDLEGARIQIGYLVGRDTTKLSEEEIIRATVETVAENTVDGVLAPLLYMGVGMIFNMPLQFAFIYKAVNTMDSMVGYKNEKYRDIGFAAAKLDDLLNYIPARIGSIYMGIAGGILGYNIKNGFKILLRDRKNHKSPNCGYPESVVAGLLDVQIGGTNIYFGEIVEKPTIGDKNRDLKNQNIADTCKIMYISELLLLVTIIIIAQFGKLVF